MELILENTERMVSGVLKFFAEAKFLIFSATCTTSVRYYLRSIPLPKTGASPLPILLCLEGQSCTCCPLMLGRWLTPLRGSSCSRVISRDEGVTSPRLHCHLSVLLSETSWKMLEPEAVLKLSAPEEPSSPWSWQRLSLGDVCAPSPGNGMEQMAH